MVPLLDVMDAASPTIPLVVDFDGTLCTADTLTWLRRLCRIRRPLLEVQRIRKRRLSKQAEKVFLWERIGLDLDSLPFDQELIATLDLIRLTGRPVVLAT